MSKKIAYSAPGKIILSGEHSVVYGEPALVTALNIRLTFCLEEAIRPQSQKVPEIGILKDKAIDFLQQKEIPFKEKYFSTKINSDIPIGQGFGSSAAFSVAGSASILELFTGQEPSKELINELAYEMEKHFHGKPSGIDNSVSCYGGLCFYRKEFEFLKSFHRLPFTFPNEFQDNILFIFSGDREETTIDLVKEVMARLEEDPARYKKLLRDIGKTTKAMTIALNEGIEKEKLFTDTIAKNQKLLHGIGVVSQQTQNLLAELSKYGVGKISGAGGLKSGSGYLFFYCTKNLDALKDYLKRKKIPFILPVLELEGVVKVH